ncbi:SSU ribosomal protein S3p (S3e) [hydrothermal vent metagenome]|uniref:SSU ribosomal protein S3p (S3e) n=1 Tax=hydrothermal vent metagenome TaxID=652676 RepID=A0A3B0UZA7_9ZZZZ
MTHVTHPYAHRLGIIRDWKSRWFALDKKQYRENLKVDSDIRTYLAKRLRGTHTSDIEIERTLTDLRIFVNTARPGLVIGRSGENATKIRAELARIVKKSAPNHNRVIKLDITEIRQPETDATIVAYMIAESLEKRMMFRRVLKQTAEKVMAVRGVLGVRIAVSGRLGGADMSRKEEVKKGRIPLQTFRADIGFAREQAHLPYGVIGIKVWIYRGDKHNTDKLGAHRM